MSEIFAHPGEAVTDRDGNVICIVKNPLKRHEIISALDFHKFVEGEKPWKEHDVVDTRCVRPGDKMFGMQICIEGEWRP